MSYSDFDIDTDSDTNTDMESLKIDLKKLEDGITTLNIPLDDEFFQSVNGPEVSRGKEGSQGQVHVTLFSVQ